MKKYKIQIIQEDSSGRESLFFNRSKEELIFQIMLPEDEVDIKAVFKQIVAGKGIS